MRIVAPLLLCLVAATALAGPPDTYERPHHLWQDLLLEETAWEPPTWGPPAPAGRAYDNLRINTDSTQQLQNEQQVVVNPLNPDNLVATWRDFRLGHREVGIGYSLDGGQNWTDYLIDGPAQYSYHSDPGLTVDRQGNIYACILSYNDTSSPNGLFVLKSGSGGASWGAPVAAVDGVNGVFEDKQLIACDRTTGPHDGNLYVSWSRFYSTQIYNVRSIDGGQSFEPEVRVSDSGGVQWPLPVVCADGTLVVAWVHFSPTSIRLDRSFDGGATFGSDITLTSLYAGSPTLNGGVKSYSYPAMDVDLSSGPHHGRLYVAYMDRYSGDYDMFIRWSDDQGATWTDRMRLNDDAVGNGADQFHPWLSVGQDGSVNVIFYDRRLDPGNYWMDLYFTQSLDGGQTWSANERVTELSSDPAAGQRAGLIGEYIGLAAVNASKAHAVWTDTRNGNQDTYTATISDLTAVGSAPLAGGLRLSAPTPNPFRGSTRLTFSARPGARVAATVYDLSGRALRRLHASGEALVWDGRDERGRALGSGVYLIRADDGAESAAARVMLLR